MKKYVVMTSVFQPTEAISSFAAMDNVQLVVAGDKKTSSDWYHDHVLFIAADTQGKSNYRLGKYLPWNHYSRKMFGYLQAIKMGANVIIDSDDDNIPTREWKVPDFDHQVVVTKPDLGFVNIYKCFSDLHIWPRGFPLELINSPNSLIRAETCQRQTVSVGIWQMLIDGDTDVDAIYRLTNNSLCYFKQSEPIALAEGTLCPFNSQNTAFRKELFALLYLPSTVTFRFTDILRGLVAQPVMWNAGYSLGFAPPNAIQQRNPHNYLKDFESEIPCYLFPQEVINIALQSISKQHTIADNLVAVYTALASRGIVQDKELLALDAWLHDIES